MKRVLLLPVLCWVALAAQGAEQYGAEPTTLEQVLDSSLQHYPGILAARSEIRSREALVQAAEGAFDPRIDGSAKSRLSGYYNGDSLDAELVQPLPGFNTRLFAGYRVSDGEFPVYENRYLTAEGGEFRAGIGLSLWRDRDIDERRAAVARSRIDLVSEAQSLSAQRLAVLREAWIIYARWLLSARLLEGYRELLDIATARGEGMAVQVETGDAAEILLVENRQAVLQRRALVTDAQRQLEMAAEQLALYLRDEDGRPRYPVYAPGLQMPAEDEALLAQPVEELVDRVLARRPEIRQLELEREQLELELDLARNSMQPRIDLEYYLSRDTGAGPAALAGTDNVAGVSFSMPLRTRTASGKAAAARAGIDGLNFELRLLNEQLRAQIRRAQVNLEATREMERMAIEELSASVALADAEEQRFDSGLSDFFLLNVRERQMGEAQLKRWQAHLAHQVALAEFYEATMLVEGFGGGLDSAAPAD